MSNIFNCGLLLREILENEEIYSCFNDDYRFDNCLSSVCMFLEFPNYKMFYKLRQDNSDIDWGVLRLDARILCDYRCAFLEQMLATPLCMIFFLEKEWAQEPF